MFSRRLPDPRDHLDRPERQRRYVRGLFDIVAPRYDAFTRWFSFGMDAGWKREVAREVRRRVPAGGVVLDLACGTGDLAVGRYGGKAVTVVGLDPSPEMLRAAARRLDDAGFEEAARCRLVRGDMTAIPLPAASVDAVTIGYGLRNAPSLDGALAEVSRVLRPGGWLVTLDFYVPRDRVWRWVFLRYLRWAGRLAGWVWHREPWAYGYIEASLRQWITADRLSAALARRGMAVERVSRKLGGGIAVHTVRRL